MRYAQLVMGPAGSGKSSYCGTMAQHAEDSQRIVSVVNLDPAAEYFDYTPLVDVRELIHLGDVMEDPELAFGPNGGLVFCMEYLAQHTDWLEEQLGDNEEDYILFDCPGQLELYTHMDVFRQLVELLQRCNFRVCAVFLIDSQFMTDGAKFLSGTLAALSVMINLELPHINVLSKMDLLGTSSRQQLDRFIEPDAGELLDFSRDGAWSSRYRKLTESLGRLVEDFSLVRFHPLDSTDPESVTALFAIIDLTLQYGEDLDVKTKDFEDAGPEDEAGNS